MLKFSLSLFALLMASIVCAQEFTASVSGMIEDASSKTPLPFVNVVLKKTDDSSFVGGTISTESGRYSISDVPPGNYYLEASFIGYKNQKTAIFVGSLSKYLEAKTIFLTEETSTLSEVQVTATQAEVSSMMDKKTYAVSDNISQSGGSVLQAMQNLPGVSVQEGKLELRGSDKITVLIDGKQTALTGFGNQSGLDNIPASAIERIEIINNPSSKFDANGSAGIINIIYKKEQKDGLTGKVGIAGGLGALWVKKENLPTIRPQYGQTPKVNPSLSLNYRKGKINAFLQADYLYTETLNKNEFVTRTYDDGTIIHQQTVRNRNTGFLTTTGGFDWNINESNTFTISGMYGREKIIDNGDEPFFNSDYSDRLRLWRFLEDELKTTAMATAMYRHKFAEPGHTLDVNFNYTFHREDEQYFFENINPTFTGNDHFKLLSDEKVADLNINYIKPIKNGRVEAGVKYRKRDIPTNMQFFPGQNSPLDSNAGGKATYSENIPALYGNYVFESPKYEAEIGLRVEYVDLNYQVNAQHNTYKTDGYNYFQPFPNLRLAYKLNTNNKLSFFYNRRVDRPAEVDIRIFPKYDDAEIVKVGNPALKPQFTNSFELGYKTTWKNSSLYSAAYHRIVDGTITRISTIIPGSTLIYAIFQNVNRSYNSGVELVYSEKGDGWFSYNINLNAYHNQIDAYTVENLYPTPHTFSAGKQEIISGTAKANGLFRLPSNFEAQLTATYLAPDIIPQGKIDSRFSLDLGIKKTIQNGRGEIFVNATDLLNTMIINKTIESDGFSYTSANYYETQVICFGYSYKF
ncbi:outer membrane receptor protein [Owenweeksia hongkongensis DSM 17368]|uniref:Outer membrane receptor protein n=1 Tax=Owenweeksia hongkongensis (strain DSM 17368 / CIP 108786 / JCM 12287 / NRRL B-23963 / UST20020801) TaxID=926562 RepID=G8QZA4_OWEHD|nr:outer membrane beta-barrel family protein [Owenweeksia hongkongensis]AEV31487.1 outer membrane receptor protein [Owenweeksia hongkongensis DSM 17368]